MESGRRMEGMARIDVIIMTEIFDQRKTELEIAAKNTIVEIYFIKSELKEIEQTLEAKERYLLNINASLRELEYLGVKSEEKPD